MGKHSFVVKCIGLTPFSTALLVRYPMQPIAVLAYGINALAVAILFDILWFYPRIQKLTHEEPNPVIIAKRSKIVLVGPIVYALGSFLVFSDGNQLRPVCFCHDFLHYFWRKILRLILLYFSN